MQEYRVELETLPGAGTAGVIEQVHRELEEASQSFANTTLVIGHTDTDTLEIVIFLDAMSGMIALGTAANLATRALNAACVPIPSLGFLRMEVSITDFIAPSLAWPVCTEEPVRNYVVKEAM